MTPEKKWAALRARLNYLVRTGDVNAKETLAFMDSLERIQTAGDDIHGTMMREKA